MKERIAFARAVTGVLQEQVSDELDSRMRSVNLFKHQKGAFTDLI